ncbi:hypothetical protein [Kitasatospora sp. HPMI-4]|uniref:hypothetical protein n=1 Tax=Kitasatospora sp. HPMI-4 TaxID=3448443 RepID=UPI003F1CBA65
MRNGLVQLTAWLAATSAAVALSWLGVHAVLADAAFEQPRAVALPSPSGQSADAPSGPPAATAGAASPGPSVPAAPPAPPAPSASTATSASAAAVSSAAVSSSTASSTSQAPPSSSGPGAARGARTADASVRSYLVPGGRVALDMEPDRADLVSAAPEPGWQMQVWRQDGWLRVDFSQGDKVNSVFVTWNGHPPDVQTVVR